MSGTSHGTLDFLSAGSFHYTPDPNFAGQDSFVYELEMRDLFGPGVGSDTATATITVNEVCGPAAVDDAYQTGPGRRLSVSAPGVLSNDTLCDGAVAQLASGPDHGILEFHDDGSFEYRAKPGYCGPDSFEYAIGGDSAAAVAISVTRGASGRCPSRGAER